MADQNEEHAQNKIDDAVLALLYLNFHDDGYGTRAWKGFD